MRLKQHVSSMQVSARDVLCMCVITTVCSWLVHDSPLSSLYIFVATLSFTLSARLRAALSQERKLLRTFCSRSLQLFHFLLFKLLFWHLCCIAITFTPALSSFQLTVDLLWWVQGPTPPLYLLWLLLCEFEWNQVILSFCEVFKLQAVYYLND